MATRDVRRIHDFSVSPHQNGTRLKRRRYGRTERNGTELNGSNYWSSYPFPVFCLINLSAAFCAFVESLKSSTLVCPFEPCLPQRVVTVQSSMVTSQNFESISYIWALPPPPPPPPPPDFLDFFFLGSSSSSSSEPFFAFFFGAARFFFGFFSSSSSSSSSSSDPFFAFFFGAAFFFFGFLLLLIVVIIRSFLGFFFGRCFLFATARSTFASN